MQVVKTLEMFLFHKLLVFFIVFSWYLLFNFQGVVKIPGKCTENVIKMP